MTLSDAEKETRTNRVREHCSMCDNKDLMAESHDIQWQIAQQSPHKDKQWGLTYIQWWKVGWSPKGGRTVTQNSKNCHKSLDTWTFLAEIGHYC